MSAIEWAMGLVAVVVGVGILYFIFTQGPAVASPAGPPTLTVEGLPVGFVGMPHSITVRVTNHGGEDIRLRVGGEVQTLPCPGVQCSFPLTYTFADVGLHVVEAESGYLRVKWDVDVQTKTSICLDGTPEGECSEPPLRCVNQSLVADCSICGCPTGESCETNACVKVPYSFSIGLGELTSFYTTSVSSIPILVTNESIVPANGLFVGRLQWYDSSSQLLGEAPQQFLVENLAPGATASFTIPVVLPSNAVLLNVEWFPAGGLYDDSTRLAMLPAMEKIVVSVDTTSPSPPGSVGYAIADDVLTISWNASSSGDVKEYILYQENAATGGFTTYSTLAVTPMLSYSLSLPDDDTAFVVKARDAAGNESAPTSPVVVSAS